MSRPPMIEKTERFVYSQLRDELKMETSQKKVFLKACVSWTDFQPLAVYQKMPELDRSWILRRGDYGSRTVQFLRGMIQTSAMQEKSYTK